MARAIAMGVAGLLLSRGLYTVFRAKSIAHLMLGILQAGVGAIIGAIALAPGH